MSKTLSVVMAVATIALVGVTSAFSADSGAPTSRRYANNPFCQNIWRCGPGGCNWHRVCTNPCPDGTSCTPLYGAYGPYGGVGYWGAYTDAGWAYYR